MVSNKQITGTITIHANNVTIKDSEVIADSPGSFAIDILSGVTGTLIEDSTIHGADNAANSIEYGILSNNSSTMAIRDNLYYCTECYAGPGTLQDSYAITNATESGAHYEDTYYGGTGSSLTIDHDTLFNPHNQTAAVYAYSDFGTVTNMSVTNSLLAGGDYTIYAGGSTATNVTITGNRFSRIYYPNCSTYGVADYFPTAMNWSGNVWDDTGASVTK